MPSASEPELLIGSRFASYEIERIAGRGGMGVVYCARHLQLGRRAAIKVLPPDFAASEDFRRRFSRESRVAAAIDHPNIVTVYDAGEWDGLLYIAMQFIEGSDLARVLAEERVLSVERVASVVDQIGAALDTAHARGLIHRDVKPANILVDERRVYLADFGLTKRTTVGDPSSAATAAGKFLGTVDYVAPEQITSRDLDARTDVYALGCVVYECLTGEVPYWRSQPIETLYAHIHEPVPRLRDKRPDLPPALSEVVATAMAKPKDERYDSAGAFAADLRRAATGERLLGPHGAPAEVPPGGGRVRPARRSWLVAAAAAAAIAGAALAVVAIGGDDGNEPPNPPDTRTETTQTETEPVPAPPPTARVVARVGRRPFGVLATAGGIWVTAFDNDWIRRLDPAGGAVTGERIRVGDGPIAIARGSGLLWVANNHDDTVQRVDPRTSQAYRAPIRVGDGPIAIVATARSVWVVSENDDRLTRIDGPTGAVIGSVRVGDLPRGVAATRGFIWVANRRDGTVLRVSTDTGQVSGRPIRVGRDPHSLAVARGFVWVTNNDDDTVTRIRASSGRRVGRPIRVGHAPWGIAADGSTVWVTNSAANTLTRIRARTGRPFGQPVRTGRQPSGIDVRRGRVWVANNDAGTVSRFIP